MDGCYTYVNGGAYGAILRNNSSNFAIKLTGPDVYLPADPKSAATEAVTDDTTVLDDVVTQLTQNFVEIERSTAAELCCLTFMEGVPTIIHTVTCGIVSTRNVPGIWFAYSMPLADGGDLTRRSTRKIKWTAYDVRTALACVVHALHACHSRGMLHLDVKPANVLDFLHGDYRLADFGLATFSFRHDAYAQVHTLRKDQEVQSLWYRSIELLRGRTFTAAVDMWSVGVMLIDLLNNKNTLAGAVTPEACALRWEFYLDLQPDPLEPTGFSSTLERRMCALKKAFPRMCPESVDLAARLLDPYPTSRMRAGDAMIHPFFKRKTDILLEKCKLPPCRPVYVPIDPSKALLRCTLVSTKVWDVVMDWLPYTAPSGFATLHAIDLLLRFMEFADPVTISLSNLQAFAAACMCLVCKVLDDHSHDITLEFARECCAGAYTMDQLCAAELCVLTEVDFRVIRGPCMLDMLPLTLLHADAAVAAACSLDFLGAPDALDVVREVAETPSTQWGTRARTLGALQQHIADTRNT